MTKWPASTGQPQRHIQSQHFTVGTQERVDEALQGQAAASCGALEPVSGLLVAVAEEIAGFGCVGHGEASRLPALVGIFGPQSATLGP
jgi:hypothetical protein